ncbi:MAG: peptidase domain-containing ABC transporter [Cellulophaga sp.]
MNRFPFFKQAESKDCGPTCLRIIAKHYNKIVSIQKLRSISETSRSGTSLYKLSEAAEKIGFRTLGVKISIRDVEESPLPIILHWNSNHFVVLYKIKKGNFYISDPGFGLISYTTKEFLQRWISPEANEETEEGIALIVEPTPNFYKNEWSKKEEKFGFSIVFSYLKKYKSFIWQLVIGLAAASILQLILPFLTQSIVDIGIRNEDLNFIYLILVAQLSLFIGRSLIEVLRGWILLHLSTRVNIALVSDFFLKLMNLPIAYFDARMTGDILQRINDHKRIEKILTISSLNVLFSTFNLVIFSFVLAFYSLQIFFVFFIGSLFYFIWIAIFLKKRRDLDYKKFSQVSQEQSKVIELINGMQEIKLHNAERQKRWGWEFLQAKLFKISIESLTLNQFQNVGSNFINELKNIIITVLSAKLVIDGEITLGMMLAISYIVGQMNSPISQLINFVRELQDAQISLERLGEIHNKEDEEPSNLDRVFDIDPSSSFYLKNVSFRYLGSDNLVLKELNLKIPSKKITAIVGTSGSGKTTLLKLLLKFYKPIEGIIKLDSSDLNKVSHKKWRAQCGVVMQESYIFNDTIANNIALGEDQIDLDRLEKALNIANIKSFIESLPLSYNTKIGSEGVGLSTGQKQRLLIARAIYKNPSFLFFDEATSALDANNERVIMENLNEFFKEKTVIIIAHRLSTVKNAHQIVVLKDGQIAETGNHTELVKNKRDYFELIKNQLELGN